MSTCRGHADLTPGCTECALAEARAEVERLNGVLHKQATAFFEANAAIAKLDKEADEYGRALEDARALLADSPTAAARQVSAALRERDEARRHLGNLLARIHRDGGHYEAKHGTEKAVKDADYIVAQLYTDADTAKGLLNRFSRGEDNTAILESHVVLLKYHKDMASRLREALTQVVVDINDPHPRMGTLEGFRGAMENTEKMVRRVLDGGEV